MSAPKKSLRPKARPKSIYGVGEKSTQSPDGITIAEREKKARTKPAAKTPLRRVLAALVERLIRMLKASSSRMKKEEQESHEHL
jgi:hypothetical protein